MAMAIIDGYKVGGVDEPTVADEYNEEREWEVGEFCIYNSTLYKCNTATTGEFDSDSWDVTSCGLEMKGINSNLTDNESLETTSKNTWGAINELLSYLTWKDCTIANKVITLPQDYREISILIYSGFNNIHLNYSLSKKVIDALPTNSRLFVGYGGNGVTYATLVKGGGTLTLQESYIDGTNRTSTATVNAYYR